MFNCANLYKKLCILYLSLPSAKAFDRLTTFVKKQRLRKKRDKEK